MKYNCFPIKLAKIKIDRNFGVGKSLGNCELDSPAGENGKSLVSLEDAW